MVLKFNIYRFVMYWKNVLNITRVRYRINRLDIGHAACETFHCNLFIYHCKFIIANVCRQSCAVLFCFSWWQLKKKKLHWNCVAVHSFLILSLCVAKQKKKTMQQFGLCWSFFYFNCVINRIFYRLTLCHVVCKHVSIPLRLSKAQSS